MLDGSLTCRTVYNEPLLRLTRQDQARFRHLLELHSSEVAHSSVSVAGATNRREEASENSFIRWVPPLGAVPTTTPDVYRWLPHCCSFFMDLNHNLFALMARVAQTEDHVLTAEHIAEVGLDPDADRLFLANLALLHGFDLTVQHQQDMCCLFNCF